MVGVSIAGIFAHTASYQDSPGRQWALSLFALAVPLLTAGYLCTVTKTFHPRFRPESARGELLMSVSVFFGELSVIGGLGCTIGSCSASAAWVFGLGAIGAVVVVANSEDRRNSSVGVKDSNGSTSAGPTADA